MHNGRFGKYGDHKKKERLKKSKEYKIQLYKEKNKKITNDLFNQRRSKSGK